MRSTLIPAVLAASLALSGAAFAAATSTQGVLKSVDIAKHMIVLMDGTSIQLPAVFKDPGLKPGTKVNVVWQMVGNTHQAEAVTIVK